MIGTTVGHYRIEEKIGEGGMGAVFRATDTHLGREVAIKVLPSNLAADPERVARFEREARLLASLDHPNIAAIYAFETAVVHFPAGGEQSIHFLVMQLVEGSTLQDRLARSGMRLQDALSIGLQIAHALESAHEKGIVHRDLKPGNVMVDSEGRVRLLDFGLAKALHGDTAEDQQLLSQDPTMDTPTRAGTVLGTAPYMSPEQARGEAVDQRSDIWAFGCLLYEMLTRTRAFPGRTATDSMARVLEGEPDWSLIPGEVPETISGLLHRCLQKDPGRRLRDARDIAISLEDIEASETRPLDRAVVEKAPRRSGWVTWIIPAVAVVLAVLGWLRPFTQNPQPPSKVYRFAQPLKSPLDLSQAGHVGSAVALSPDGRYLVWVETAGTTTQLFMRALDSPDARPIPGTEGAVVPFFSPDSLWVAFEADGWLKKVSLQGGSPKEICEVEHLHGASWGDDGIIVFSDGGFSPLSYVACNGGTPRHIVAADGAEVHAEYPFVLPGSRFVLTGPPGQNRIDLLSLKNGQAVPLVMNGRTPSYLPSGHLVWIEGADLVAARFDLESMSIVGDALPVVKGVLTEQAYASHYTISKAGHLAYLPGGEVEHPFVPIWVDLKGETTDTGLPGGEIMSPRLSPDGNRLLFTRQDATRSFWIADLNRGVLDRFTRDEGDEFWGIWSPDGERVIFNSTGGGKWANVFSKASDGSKPARRLTNATAHQLPMDITDDGRLAVLGVGAGMHQDMDIYTLRLEENGSAEPLLSEEFTETHPAISPDGEWLAYTSDETGALEVYVRPFRGDGGAVRISRNGGLEPLWSPDGRRLYYRSRDGRRATAAELQLGDSLRVTEERQIFEGNFRPGIQWGRFWDIHPDGDRFIMLEVRGPEAPTDIEVVVNWAEELKELVPVKRK